MYEDRTYVIVNVSDITDDMIDGAIQLSLNDLRKTIDDSKALLKWSGDTPSCFDGITTYTHSEILTELAKSEWTGE